MDVSQYTYYHPFFLRGLPHLVKYIKRIPPEESRHAKAEGRILITEADLERLSAEAPVPDRVSETSSANAAIQRINYQYEINQLREEQHSGTSPRAQPPASVSFPSPMDTTSSHILARQLGRPAVNYEPMLPISATSQLHNAEPPLYSSDALEAYNNNLSQLGSGLPAPEIPPPVGWDGVTNALLQAFQAAQAQRQLQDRIQYDQLTLLTNAIAAYSQNTQGRLPYYPLNPSQLAALRSALATLSPVPNVPSSIYAPLWGPGAVQQQNLAAQQQQQQQPQPQPYSNFYDGTTFSQNAEPNDEYDNEQNNSE